MSVRVSRLSQGMTLLTDPLPHFESVSLGIWLKRGSRDESGDESGMFHFIEHTLFKGTPSRGARQIAEAFDGIGGYLDAYTAKEETCYSFKVRDLHLDSALEILADMILNPVFNDEELDRERQVVLEEIAMEQDDPEEVVFEHNLRQLWADHPLGAPILGPPENIQSFSRAKIRAFHNRHYRSENLIVAASGRVDHDHLLRRLEALFPGQEANEAAEAARSHPLTSGFQNYYVDKNWEQINFCLSFPALALNDPDAAVLNLLVTAIGGGMSSRLFQRVREERGLAYSIGAFSGAYTDCGYLSVAGGCRPENFDEVIQLSLGELADVARKGLQTSELDRARAQTIGSLVMGLESSFFRASMLSKHWIYLGETFDPSTTIRRIEAVRMPEVQALAQRLFVDEKIGLSALGRLKGTHPDKAWSLEL